MITEGMGIPNRDVTYMDLRDEPTKLAAEVVKLKQEMAKLRKMVAENHMMIMSLRGIINSWMRQVCEDTKFSPE